MAADYFAPAFRVAVNGAELAADVSKNVMDLSVTSEPDTLDHCSLTLANPYPALRWTHEPRDADMFKEGNGLTVDLGYDKHLTRMFDGEITAISPTFPESGTPTVRIEAYTRLHRLRGAPQTRTFVGMTDKEIAQRVADELKLKLDADDPGVVHPYVIQFNQTDLAFLLERAPADPLQLSVDERTLRFKRGGEGQQRALTLVWGSTPQAPSAEARRSRCAASARP